MGRNALKLIEDNDDWGCLSFLIDSGRYQHMNGIIYPYDENVVETSEETEVINYLCGEWDFGFQKNLHISGN